MNAVGAGQFGVITWLLQRHPVRMDLRSLVNAVTDRHTYRLSTTMEVTAPP